MSNLDMTILIDKLVNSLNELDAKISMLNRKLNSTNKHIIYIYLILLLNTLLNLIMLFKNY